MHDDRLRIILANFFCFFVAKNLCYIDSQNWFVVLYDNCMSDKEVEILSKKKRRRKTRKE